MWSISARGRRALRLIGVGLLVLLLGSAAVLAVLRPRASVRVTIPEGSTRFDVARRIARAGIADEASLLAATLDDASLSDVGVLDAERRAADAARVPRSLEGYLFPDTYELRADSAPAAVMRRLVANWKRRTAALLRRTAQRRAAWTARGVGLHALVTLASIVEREARAAHERPIIAGVFANRLFARPEDNTVPRRLQADPTVAYGCLATPARSRSCDRFGGRVRPAMTAARDNPYSTYAITGLPPGPIACPGLASLAAAIEPAEHDYLYFVAVGEGRHHFSRTFSEHNRAVHR